MVASPQTLFFFQAEDGIRDLTVTGVQTCALPILLLDEAVAQRVRGDVRVGLEVHLLEHAAAIRADGLDREAELARDLRHRARSEERRVGKECRGGGAPSVMNNNAAVCTASSAI